MSYILDQLKQVQPQKFPPSRVKVKFLTAFGQTNFITLSPDTFAKVAAVIAEAEGRA